MRPLEPGVFGMTFGRLAERSEVTSGAMIDALALAIERQAKSDLGQRSHSYGTRSPATRGGPPAKITGNLQRSVTHTPAKLVAAEWHIWVGPGAGFVAPSPPYHKSQRKPAGEYGRYLEQGGYPWLKPAAQKVAHSGVAGLLARRMILFSDF